MCITDLFSGTRKKHISASNSLVGFMIKAYNPEDKVFLAVDCIIFGFDDEDLKVLLIQRNFEPEKGKCSLIGGF